MSEELKQLFGEMREAIRAAVWDEKNLWPAARCAAYLGYSTRYFQRAVATMRDFPEPIVLPTATRSGGNERWRPEEVKAWADRFRVAKVKKGL